MKSDAAQLGAEDSVESGKPEALRGPAKDVRDWRILGIDSHGRSTE